MKDFVSRRQFLGTSAVAVAGLALPSQLLGAKRDLCSFLPSHRGSSTRWSSELMDARAFLEARYHALGKQPGFDVTATKDGQIFDSKDFHKHAAVLFTPPAT